MLGLLLLQFRSLTEALIVLASVPFALVGSFWTLFLLGYPLSAPVWVGLLSVVGLAMQTGVVMVVYIDEAFHRRVREGRLRSRDDIVDAHAEGTVQRLRPKIMTITTMAASLLPLLWADGAGADVMRRVAAPMLGGLATSAFLTLEVLPVLYTIWRHRQLRRAIALGVPIASIVGPARVGLPTNGHGTRAASGTIDVPPDATIQPDRRRHRRRPASENGLPFRADGDLGRRRGGPAVDPARLETDIAGGDRAEGRDLHLAVGRPRPRGRLGERRAVRAGQDSVRRDRAGGQRNVAAVLGHVGEHPDVGLARAEIYRDRLGQRARRAPDGVPVVVVDAVDRVRGGAAGRGRAGRRVGEFDLRPLRGQRRARRVLAPGRAHLAEPRDDRRVQQPLPVGRTVEQEVVQRGSSTRRCWSTMAVTLIRLPMFGAQNQSLPPAALIFVSWLPAYVLFAGAKLPAGSSKFVMSTSHGSLRWV